MNTSAYAQLGTFPHRAISIVNILSHDEPPESIGFVLKLSLGMSGHDWGLLHLVYYLALSIPFLPWLHFPVYCNSLSQSPMLCLTPYILLIPYLPFAPNFIFMKLHFPFFPPLFIPFSNLMLILLLLLLFLEGQQVKAWSWASLGFV